MGKRRNRSPEEEARRAKIRELLQESNIGSILSNTVSSNRTLSFAKTIFSYIPSSFN